MVQESSKKYSNSAHGRVQNKKRNNEYISNGRIKIHRANKMNKIKKDPDKYALYKLERSCRSRLWVALKVASTKKNSSLRSLIGCSTLFLRDYLQKKFYTHPLTNEKMTWKNYGRAKNLNTWVVDHKIPVDFYIKNYDFKDLKVQKICFHYTNLRPMWEHENLIKSNKLIVVDVESKFSNIIFKKTYDSKSQLRILDNDIKKALLKYDPDLEIDLKVQKNPNGSFEAMILSTKLN